MSEERTLIQVKQLLEEDGFTGLFYPGECACHKDDLAPCGECEPVGDYINDCEGGYIFYMPGGNDLAFIVKQENKEPTAEEWEKFKREYF